MLVTFPVSTRCRGRTAGSVDVPGVSGATVFTSITNPSGTPTVARRQQTGNVSYISALGGVGAAPKLDFGFFRLGSKQLR